MKKLLTLTIIIFASLSGFSQDGNQVYGRSVGSDLYARIIDINEKSKAFGLTEAQFNSIKDEAYANPKFIEGNIYQDDKVMKANVPMRYNAYSDEIEIKNGSSTDFGALTKDPSIYAKIFNDIYVFIPFEGSNEKGGYFNILVDGKTYDLYKKTKATFHEPHVAKSNYDRDQAPFFSKDVTYYLVQNGKFFELPSSKNKILKAMDKKKSEIKEYMKANNLDLDKEADLVKLVTYFDSLL